MRSDDATAVLPRRRSAAPPETENRRGGRLAGAARRAVWPAISIVVALALWQLMSKEGVLPSEIPAPVAAARSLIHYAGQGSLGSPLVSTVVQWLVGLAVGTAAGLCVGTAIGLSRRVYNYVEFLIDFLRPMPSVIYFPLVLLEIGAYNKTAILLAGIGSFWPVLFSASYGARATERVAVDTGRVFGMSSSRIVVRIVVPSALPYLTTGIRQSTSIALIVVVTTELLGGAPGLGAVISDAEQNGQYGLLYGVLFLVGILGVIANNGFQAVERRVLHWHPSQRRATQRGR